MAVEHNIDLLYPIKLISQRKELDFLSYTVKFQPLTNYSPISGCFFLTALLKPIVVSRALSYSLIPKET